MLVANPGYGEYTIYANMEIEHGCQVLQNHRIGNTDYTKSQGSLPDYIIDRFMRSLRVRESPRQYPGCRHNQFPSARSHVRSPDVTEDLLKKVRVKLQMVERDRYIMQQMARIEKCHCGMGFQELERIQWYDYSGCPKKYNK